MAFKHALVVDDSKSARLALKALLEKHELIVHFAETGEEAIEFLRNQHVDAIFMDHSMPGMTGLEAVSLIKKNPRTAMIPVMMYTAQEGEVFVGQARALGAVGVLPKEVSPSDLFEMLLKLGLVTERRGRGRKPRAASPLASAEPPAGSTDDKRPHGMALESLVTRVLEDQHLQLRTELLASHRDFARQVATEIFEKQKTEQALERLEAETEQARPAGAMTALALALAVAGVLLAVLWWRGQGELESLRAANSALVAAAEQERLNAQSQTSDLLSGMDAERREAEARYLGFIEAIEWGVNAGSQVPFGEIAFDDIRLQTLRELLMRLTGLGFRGIVRLESHLGEFCLVTDGHGELRLAEPEMDVSRCEIIGHPLDDSVSVSDRQSLAFANFLATSPLVNESGILVQLVAHDRRDSIRRYPYPANLRTAGQWNRVAELNNRVQYDLVPDAL